MPSIEGLKASRLVYRKLTAKGIAISETRLEMLRIVKTRCDEWEVSRCDIRKWDVAEGTRLAHLTLNGSEVKSMRIWDSDIRLLAACDSTVTIETTRRCDIQRMELKNTIVRRLPRVFRCPEHLLRRRLPPTESHARNKGPRPAQRPVCRS